MKLRNCVLALALVLPTAVSARVIGPSSVEVFANGVFQHESFSEDLGSTTQCNLAGGVLFATGQFLQLGGDLGLTHEAAHFTGFPSYSATAFGAEALLRVNLGSSFRRGASGIILGALRIDREQ